MTSRWAVVSITTFLVVTAAACGGESPTQPTQPPNKFTVSGVVREQLPSGAAGLAIKSVDVRASGLSGAAASVVTDEEGRYSIGVAAGSSFNVDFSKDGFQSASVHVDALAANRTVDATLKPVFRTLSGRVAEAASGTPVVAATVRILSGSNAGRTTQTDVSGQFTLEGVWGEFDVSISVAGYEPATVRVVVDAKVTEVNVRLNRNQATLHTVFTGALCTVATPYPWSPQCKGSSFPYPVQAHHQFSAQRPGTMTLAVSYRYVGDYYWNYLSVELRCGGQLVAQKRVDNLWDSSVVRPDNIPGPIQIALSQPCDYELKLFDFVADRKGGDWTTCQVEVTYPKQGSVAAIHPRVRLPSTANSTGTWTLPPWTAPGRSSRSPSRASLSRAARVRGASARVRRHRGSS